MKIVGALSLLALVCGATARPQSNRQLSRQHGFNDNFQYEIIPIISDNRYGPIDGQYTFDFETANGIYRREQGNPTGHNGAVISEGDWSFTFPDGSPGQFSFIADEGGYRVESPLLPPIPAHALEQIERSARERAAGITHDGQWDPARYGGGQWDPVRYGGGYYNPAQQFRGQHQVAQRQRG